MNTKKALIIKSARREFTCKLLDNQREVSATALGKLLKKDTLVVGDLVTIDIDNSIILSRDERKNVIFRRIIRENTIKPVASNLDQMVIIVTVNKPDYKRGMLDRYLLRAAQWDIPPAIVFNKIDLEFNKDIDFDFEIRRVKDLNIPIFFLSSINEKKVHQDYPNYHEFKDFIKNKRSIFLGQSGVGKSKLISALSGQKVNLASQEIGKVGKGTHTTTWTELVEFEHFSFVDSPGVRTLSVLDISTEEIDSLFPDLFRYVRECKFRDCKHLSESHKCRFQDDDIGPEVLSRLESLIRIKDEISAIPEWQKE